MKPSILPERFATKVRVDENGCWIWIGAVSSRGYGSIGYEGRVWSTHRLAYELIIDAIPDGLTIDHLCMVKLCCNPKHLEPVTAAVNSQRYAATITKCVHGHPFSPENTYIHTTRLTRICRECRRFQQRQNYARNHSRSALATLAGAK